jgi:hypothetical protein
LPPTVEVVEREAIAGRAGRYHGLGSARKPDVVSKRHAICGIELARVLKALEVLYTE